MRTRAGPRTFEAARGRAAKWPRRRWVKEAAGCVVPWRRVDGLLHKTGVGGPRGLATRFLGGRGTPAAHKGKARSGGTAAYLSDWGRTRRRRGEVRPWRFEAVQGVRQHRCRRSRAPAWRRTPAASAAPSFLPPSSLLPPLLSFFLAAAAAAGKGKIPPRLGFAAADWGLYRGMLGFRASGRLGHGRRGLTARMGQARRGRRGAHPGGPRWGLARKQKGGTRQRLMVGILGVSRCGRRGRRLPLVWSGGAAWVRPWRRRVSAEVVGKEEQGVALGRLAGGASWQCLWVKG